MVSYKKLYEELLKKQADQLEFMNTPIATGFICPRCEKYQIFKIGSEFVCSDPNCQYDKLDSEVFQSFAEMRRYEKVSDEEKNIEYGNLHPAQQLAQETDNSNQTKTNSLSHLT
ncbi:MAG: hypothetical protein ACTSRI_05070 [Promethearchaeota archaeon]